MLGQLLVISSVMELAAYSQAQMVARTGARPPGGDDPEVGALAIDPVTPTTLYAGDALGNVIKSTDGGKNWSEVSTDVSGNVWALAIDPVTPTTLYAGATRDTVYAKAPSGGVFKSTDGGKHWSPVNTGLTDTDVEALAIDPVTPTILYAGTSGGGVFKSTNGGKHWSPVNTGLAYEYGVVALAIDPIVPTTLYAGTSGDGVFKSTDGGKNWSPLNTGLTNTNVEALAIDPVTPTILYAGTSGGVFAIQQAK